MNKWLIPLGSIDQSTYLSSRYILYKYTMPVCVTFILSTRETECHARHSRAVTFCFSGWQYECHANWHLFFFYMYIECSILHLLVIKQINGSWVYKWAVVYLETILSFNTLLRIEANLSLNNKTLKMSSNPIILRKIARSFMNRYNS